ncbi:MAG: hypothetical protein S4CHLAM37_13110 [Chlamydiia bacterium]|nr:hypothetical protein [Chlamydiia bacterium]
MRVLPGNIEHKYQSEVALYMSSEEVRNELEKLDMYYSGGACSLHFSKWINPFNRAIVLIDLSLLSDTSKDGYKVGTSKCVCCFKDIQRRNASYAFVCDETCFSYFDLYVVLPEDLRRIEKKVLTRIAMIYNRFFDLPIR